MTTYLQHGWFESRSRKTLRKEVVDGAMDIAGALLRSKVSPEILQSLALQVRTAIALSNPQMRGLPSFGDDTRQVVFNKFDGYLDDSPELASFLMDCLDHIHTPGDLLGFYLHLIHISKMVQLLSTAVSSDSSKIKEPSSKKLVTQKKSTSKPQSR